ncbi:hypothetical protein MTO96_049015 [Rhipicephalus appendiculatus]
MRPAATADKASSSRQTTLSPHRGGDHQRAYHFPSTVSRLGNRGSLFLLLALALLAPTFVGTLRPLH